MKKEMDKKYDLVTLMLDGTHIPIWNKSEHPGGHYFSYKNKDFAYNILVISSEFNTDLLNIILIINQILLIYF